ncbi:type II secretion system F family protein [Streptomyces ortus]|uniref:Type II secretion system F family protein n=1 Tax=Streptomyces ortus TaxID=2867268 RepID=A0ABT3V785_9ACTN|nr:type II secretion system F family protein [Streptomyces ortus]MCX4235824.1 type II secretion system F family protein [Streptomyces ortus]
MSAEVVHRLEVAVCVVAGLWVLARSVEAARQRRGARRRCAALLTIPADEREPAVEGAHLGRRSRLRDGARRWLPVVGALSACWVFVGGTAGVLVGLGAVFGMWRWQRGSASTAAAVSAQGFDAVQVARQLPLAADLLAACIAAGASPVLAARAVGEALEGPVGARLARGAAEMRLGGAPAEAWSALAALPGARGLARLLERAGESGVPAAVPVARLASEARAERERAATARARRAGVLITAPVGLCFLPAFIAIGVLPVVLGLASGVLGGGDG